MVSLYDFDDVLFVCMQCVGHSTAGEPAANIDITTRVEWSHSVLNNGTSEDESFSGDSSQLLGDWVTL